MPRRTCSRDLRYEKLFLPIIGTRVRSAARRARQLAPALFECDMGCNSVVQQRVSPVVQSALTCVRWELAQVLEACR